MKPSDCLKATSCPEHGLVVLKPKSGFMMFLGASVIVTAHPSYIHRPSSIGIAPHRDKPGIVAVRVYQTHDRTQDGVQCFLLLTRWTGAQPVIDLDQEWISCADRPGQVQDYYLVAQMDGQWYTNSEKFAEEGARLVLDPGILCKYLAGDISPEELKTNALEEKSVRSELARLRGEVAMLQGEVARLKTKNTRFFGGDTTSN